MIAPGRDTGARGRAEARPYGEGGGVIAPKRGTDTDGRVTMRPYGGGERSVMAPLPNAAPQSAGRLSKDEGSYYTPPAIAEAICDIAEYAPARAQDLDARVIDPAAGDGAILAVAVGRFIACAHAAGIEPAEIARRITAQFFAYEIEAQELARCREGVAAVAQAHGVPLAAADLIGFQAGNAFDLFAAHTGTMDFVLGNPPYVRIHNLAEKPDSPYVEGMCDLFYPFFDIGQRLLANDGALCFIAPSSWFTARAGAPMRADLREREAVAAVCDFGHFQVFAPYATAYTAIVKLTRGGNERVKAFFPNAESGRIERSADLPQNSCWVNGLFMPGVPPWMEEALHATGPVRVRNGYATNLDRVFMSKTARFAGEGIERPVVKASTCEERAMIYPYDRKGRLLPFEEIRSSCPAAAAALEADRSSLTARSQVPADTWWRFGRTQGIADTFADKVAMQSLVKPGQPVRTREAPTGCGVYGGVYVVGMERAKLDAAVNSPEFFAYAAALRKYKSGGYFSLGGKDIERFLNWWTGHD